jgi:hypothetical protein
MDEEESLVRHLPDDPETAESEDCKGYQTNETLPISTTQLYWLNVPIRSNTECIQTDQSCPPHKPHRSIQSYESKSKASIIAPKLDVGNSVPGKGRQ